MVFLMKVVLVTFIVTISETKSVVSAFQLSNERPSTRIIKYERAKPVRASFVRSGLEPVVRPVTNLNLSGGENESEKSKLSIMDRLIVKTALPSMLNLAIVPLVSSVETMWIGRMGNALALAGQAAASAAFLTSFYLLSFLPNIAAPMVASLNGAGKHDEARTKVTETLSLCTFLGFFSTILLTTKPMWVLQLVLKHDSPALEVAIPYLRLQALSLIPSIITSTSFAAFRGTLDTKTPLLVCIVASLLKLLLDPLCIFHLGLGAAGAPISTFVSELLACVLNFWFLWKKDLLDVYGVLKLPRWRTLRPILAGGSIMLVRQITINICTLATSRSVQSLDQTGVSAAAFGILNQIYTIGFVVHVAMQGTAAAIIPSELARSGKRRAKSIANRLFSWSIVTGCTLGLVQSVVLPHLLKLFTPLMEVQNAIRAPAIIASLLHAVNGPRFVGEGEMMGLGNFRDLTLITVFGMLILMGALRSQLGKTLEGIMLCNLIFCTYQTVSLVLHYLFVGKLSRRRMAKDETASD